ncbi:MAG: cupin domain-containing protein [Thermodesulfobacteriota bacterium]
MNGQELEAQLISEGFSGIFVHRDSPNAFYPEHTHCGITAHIVLDGEITVTSEGQTVTYKTGDRFDVPSGEVHSASIGSNGCRYMIGEK